MSAMPTAFNAAAAHTLALAAWLQDAAFDAGGGGVSFFMMLLQTLFALGLVCGLAYVVFRWVLPRLNAVRPSGGMIRVVERVGLDARKSIYVVEVAGRWLVVASSEAGVQVLSELDAEAASEASREAERLRPTFGSDAAAIREAFAERLSRVINRKGGGQ